MCVSKAELVGKESTAAGDVYKYGSRLVSKKIGTDVCIKPSGRVTSG